MLHSLLENRWFQVSGGFEGPGRAISGGSASKKGATKRSYTPPLGEKNAGVFVPKKDLLSVGVLEKLWEINRNYEK